MQARKSRIRQPVFKYLILLAFTSPTAIASLRTDLSLENFANTPGEIEGRGDLEWSSVSDKWATDYSHRSQLHFNFFYETGRYGDRSIDPDIAVWRFRASEHVHIWGGRAHPLLEGFEGQNISYASAIGDNWLQNQANALTPNVVGWIGTGLHVKMDGWFFTLSASPIYFPNFGPKTDLSEDNDAKGSRYARLPPQYVRLNGNLVPLRFHIDTGDIFKIIFQPQALGALGLENTHRLLRFATWTSPTLNPEVDTSEVLRIQNNDLNVLVTAKPSFPRENFFALTWQEENFLESHFDAVYENQSHRLSLSQSFRPFSFWGIGALHTIYKPVKTSSTTPESPKYDKYLGWTELGPQSGIFQPSIRWERHFSQGREGNWVQARAKYLATSNLAFFSALNIITGSNLSYFGTWRSLDSVRVGASYLW